MEESAGRLSDPARRMSIPGSYPAPTWLDASAERKTVGSAVKKPRGISIHDLRFAFGIQRCRFGKRALRKLGRYTVTSHPGT